MAKYVIDIPSSLYRATKNAYSIHYGEKVITKVQKAIQNATPLDETFEWCHDCKEYDTEKHCCHRYSNVIRNTLKDNINAVLEDIKEEIKEEREYAYADFDEYNNEILGFDDTDICDRDSCDIGLGRAIQIINNHMRKDK